MTEAILNNYRNSYATPKIVCEFDPKPVAVQYSHERNGGRTLGVFIRQLYDIQYDEIKIIIDAFYPKHRY
uniref:Uncharacterized protein n=1 Tax=Panagrolaimus davidi TaxID=227884 RepID=A0A914PEQ2_9BILA